MSIRNAVEHMQGFGGHTSQATLAKEGYAINGTYGIGVASDRGNARYFASGDNDWFGFRALTARSTRYYCFAYRWDGGGGDFMQVEENLSPHVRLRQNADGTISLIRGTTTVLATTTKVFVASVWYWLALKVTVHDSTGEMTLKVFGTTEATFSGDTRNGGTSGVQTGWVLGDLSTSTVNISVTDIFVLNGDHVDADYLPEMRVDSIFPDADGDVNDGTPSTGSDHYALVDESPGYNEADYVDLTAVNQDELYGMPAPPVGGTIYGVAVVPYAGKTDSGDCSIKNQIKASGGTTTQGATIALSTTPLMYYEQFADVPGGTGWADADVSGMQVGAERTL